MLLIVVNISCIRRAATAFIRRKILLPFCPVQPQTVYVAVIWRLSLCTISDPGHGAFPGPGAPCFPHCPYPKERVW